LPEAQIQFRVRRLGQPTEIRLRPAAPLPIESTVSPSSMPDPAAVKAHRRPLQATRAFTHAPAVVDCLCAGDRDRSVVDENRTGGSVTKYTFCDLSFYVSDQRLSSVWTPISSCAQ
jgi:hypothetical protein